MSILVPIVMRTLRTKAYLVRAEVSAPAGTYILPDSVGPIGLRLCAASQGATKRDAWPGRVVLCTPKPRLAESRVEGRSCELAMALRALAASEGLSFRQLTCATGVVNDSPAHLGNVERIDELGLKLNAVTEEHKRRPDLVFLVPAANQDELASIYPHGVPAWIRPVATLAEAATVAFGSGFTPATYGPLRASIEARRFDSKQVTALFDDCAKLWDEARHGSDYLALQLQYHALTTAAFAAGRLPLATIAGFEVSGSPKAVAAALQEMALKFRDTYRDHLAPDLQAAHLNFLAVRGVYSSATHVLEASLALINEALALPNLPIAPENEYRKLLGTRGQLLWRIALRQWSCGNVDAAKHWVSQAVDDLERALVEASKDGVAFANDRARVLVYVAHVRTIAWLLRKEASDLERAKAALSQVLGPLTPASLQVASELAAEPVANPEWAVDAAWQLLAVQNDHSEIVRHCKELCQNDRTKWFMAGAGSSAPWPRLAAWLACAMALQSGIPTAAALAKALPAGLPLGEVQFALTTLARWLGYGVASGDLDWAKRWVADLLASPLTGVAEPAVAKGHLQVLQRALNRRRGANTAICAAGWRLAAWLGEPAPFALGAP